MRLLLMGPPGVGKGTQAARIAKALRVPAISTGDIFRSNIAAKTPLGLSVQSFLDSGSFVPDEVTNAIVQDRLAQPDCDGGFILDGYPRTADQADVLDRFLVAIGLRLDSVVLLSAAKELLVSRLSGRALEEGRSDDTEEVIRHRLVEYMRQTEAVAAGYLKRGLVCEIDGTGDVAEVTDSILAALARQSRESRQPGDSEDEGRILSVTQP